MTISINDFKSNFIGGARSNLFRVSISKVGSSLEFMCKASALPSATIGQIEVPYMGRILKVPGNRTFADWTITVLNDKNFAIRGSIESWMNEINTHETNIGATNVASIFHDGIIEQLDQDGNVLYTYEFKDLWPSELGEIAVAMDSNDQIEEFDVTFAFSYWSSASSS